MKHLKTFENYSHVNEEEEIKKFFTGKGFGKDEEFEKRKVDFENQLAEIDAKVEKNPKAFEYNKSKIESAAKSNNYLGSIITQKAKTRNTVVVYYKDGLTGAEKIASATSKEKNMFGK
jgi:ABC-type Fe3+-citrate transport system substrate-binding protein